jgi:hypothetical protein
VNFNCFGKKSTKNKKNHKFNHLLTKSTKTQKNTGNLRGTYGEPTGNLRGTYGELFKSNIFPKTSKKLKKRRKSLVGIDLGDFNHFGGVLSVLACLSHFGCQFLVFSRKNVFPIISFYIEGFVQFGCLFRSFHNL